VHGTLPEPAVPVPALSDLRLVARRLRRTPKEKEKLLSPSFSFPMVDPPRPRLPVFASITRCSPFYV